MPRAKLPQRLDPRAIEREVELTKVRLRKKLPRSWDAIAHCLGRHPAYLDAPTDSGLTVKDVLLHFLAVHMTAERQDRVTLGSTLVWLRRVRRLLEPHIASRRVRPRGLRVRQKLVADFLDSRVWLAQITHEALRPTADAFGSALRAGGVTAIAEAARQLDRAAEHHAALLRQWQERAPIAPGVAARKVEAPQEHIMELCGRLRLVWNYCAHESVRARAKRRLFVISVLEAAGIKHPGANDYQTLDRWIETEIAPPDPT